MKTKIHTYTSTEPMLKVNAFVVETDKELVIVDTTLTRSDSLALRSLADNLGKPVSGVLITHGHPDHVAGISNVVPNGDIPIYAVHSVKTLMEETEAAKHQQWSGMFGSEWIPKWTYPTQLVKDNDTVNVGGLNFTVVDIGSGGDCDANSLWLMDDNNKSAFIGDFIYKNNHTYMNDGSILRWLSNLDRYTDILRDYDNLFVGHGGTCDFSDVQRQREYLLVYCSNVLKVTGGSGIFNETTRKVFERIMLDAYPTYGCQFMIALSADRVGQELLSLSHAVLG